MKIQPNLKVVIFVIKKKVLIWVSAKLEGYACTQLKIHPYQWVCSEL